MTRDHTPSGRERVTINMRVLERRRDTTSSCPACLAEGVAEYRVPSQVALGLMLVAMLLTWFSDSDWMFLVLTAPSLAFMAMHEHGRCIKCGAGLDRSLFGGWVRR